MIEFMVCLLFFGGRDNDVEIGRKPLPNGAVAAILLDFDGENNGVYNFDANHLVGDPAAIGRWALSTN
ncbi:hypothetical protein [Zobellella sp. An-6]|uniref:hypothetical protein n=1 Tax=Zobellella sp. An-6 TaxID=3400218 RepID=UPI0040437B37